MKKKSGKQIDEKRAYSEKDGKYFYPWKESGRK